MSIILVARETIKMLHEAICGFSECLTLLSGPNKERPDGVPRPENTCLRDDVELISTQARTLMTQAREMKAALNGKEIPANGEWNGDSYEQQEQREPI